jgi:uncharacterized protein
LFAALFLAAGLVVPATPTAHVTDTAGVLSYGVLQSVDSELRNYEQNTGHHVIVWIGETTGETPLEDWTIRAAEKWKIGRAHVNDGAILFLFMRDHKVRIEVGYGLESALTDASASEIIRDTIVPRLRAGDTDGAVQAGVNRMLLTITPGYVLSVPAAAVHQPSAAATAFIFALILLFFVGFITIFVVAIRMGRRGGRYDDSSFGTSSGDSGGSSSDDGGSTGGDFGGGGASGSW